MEIWDFESGDENLLVKLEKFPFSSYKPIDIYMRCIFW